MKYTLFFLLLISFAASAQCPIEAYVTKTSQRTGDNSMSGSVIGWAASGYWWEWQVEVTGALKFTPQGGSVSTIDSGSKFGWLSDIGIMNGVRWGTSKDLESRGNGAYYTTGSGVFVAPYCGAGGTVPAANSPTQTIRRPERPTYQTAPYQDAIMHLGKDASGNLIAATQQYKSSSIIAPGNSNGASGTPAWTLVQSGLKPEYASISTTSGPSTTIKALSYSDNCLTYNVQLKTSYDGFYSDVMYIFINRPHRSIYRYWEDQHHSLGSSYSSFLSYETLTRCEGIAMDGYGVNFTPTGIASSFSNWPSIPSVSTVASPSIELALLAPAPNTCGPNGNEACNPLPTNPQNPLGNQETQNRYEVLKVGSVMLDAGVAVQDHLSRRYRDHATHTNQVTPLVLD